MCPTPADTVTLYNCTTADGVGEMVISSEDDSIGLTNADGTVHGGTSVWGEGTPFRSVSTSSTTLG